MAKRREALARRRATLGFTQESLAERLRMDRSTIARWEQGTGRPQPWIRLDIAKALDVTPEQLEQLLNPDPDHPPTGHSRTTEAARSVVPEFTWPAWHGHIDVVDPPWTLTGTRQVLHQIAGGPMDRRDFLTITGGTLTGLAGQWSTALTGFTPTPAAGTPDDRLTPETLDRLENRLAELSRLDDTLGGGELCHLAAAEFRGITRLADRATPDTATGQRLFGLITKTARLTGWLHFDAAQHAAAQNYYVAALRASTLANDPINGANVLICMSRQAEQTGHPAEAVTLAEVAEERAKHTATPRLRSMLAANKARAYAAAGYAKASGYALNDAERWLDAAVPGTDEPAWLYYYDEDDLQGMAATCWVYLGRPHRARPAMDRYLTGYSPTYVRDRAFRLVRSAQAHLQANDLEPACADLAAATDLARHTGSIRTIDLIHATRRTMSTHNREPRVRELDRNLTALTTLTAEPL